MLDFDFSFLTPEAAEAMARGMLVSLQVAGTALVFGLIWGTILAMMRLSSIRIVSLLSAAYVNFFPLDTARDGAVDFLSGRAASPKKHTSEWQHHGYSLNVCTGGIRTI
jgi:hypothetical protein